jgi:hypothetical protein
MRHLILIYCYHIDVLNEFLVNCYHLLEKSDFVDIHIDFCEDTITDEVLEKIKPSRITYSIVENRGMDVLPFVKTLYDKVLFTDTYSVVTKIQSKKSNDDWRVHAYKPLVDDYEKFLNMHLYIENFQKNEIPLMIGTSTILKDAEEVLSGYHAHDMVKILSDKFFNFTQNIEYGVPFFAGTMFMASTPLFKKMFEGIDYDEFASYFETGKPLTGYAHAMERIFGFAIREYGGKIVETI